MTVFTLCGVPGVSGVDDDNDDVWGGAQGRDPFNQNSNRSERKKWSTSKGDVIDFQNGEQQSRSGSDKKRRNRLR